MTHVLILVSHSIAFVRIRRGEFFGSRCADVLANIDICLTGRRMKKNYARSRSAPSFLPSYQPNELIQHILT